MGRAGRGRSDGWWPTQRVIRSQGCGSLGGVEPGAASSKSSSGRLSGSSGDGARRGSPGRRSGRLLSASSAAPTLRPLRMGALRAACPRGCFRPRPPAARAQSDSRRAGGRGCSGRVSFAVQNSRHHTRIERRQRGPCAPALRCPVGQHLQMGAMSGAGRLPGRRCRDALHAPSLGGMRRRKRVPVCMERSAAIAARLARLLLAASCPLSGYFCISLHICVTI